MALGRGGQLALAIFAFGALAFVFGVVAENKKPAAGIPVQGKGFVTCRYPSDPTIALGSLGAIVFPFSAVLGWFAVFYNYNGVSVPRSALFKNTALFWFFIISVGLSIIGEIMMIWATASEGFIRSKNVHHDLDTDCATAKTGLFGGAAFVALDAALMWLICIMLTQNAREDFLDVSDPKGDYGQVTTSDIDAISAARRNDV
ncbi:hypothetical protein H6P81_010108 [Aristolochia fimbriata]|uniref:Pantophysin n=1 Tax=Aristolochia fimbriata TaxID=158543 RepID=A0AAV7EMS9_ARIFI|nr:hypothetical protein H6P81_010108 [Aristolochia fimbriata]